MENREEIRKAIKYLTFHCLPANESINLHKYVMMAISALEKQEQSNAQNINSTHTSRPNALESLNILEQAKDDKGCVPMSLVRQAFRNVIEQAVDKCCETCKH